MERFSDFYYHYVSNVRDIEDDIVYRPGCDRLKEWVEDHIAITNKGSVVVGVPETNWQNYVDLNVIPVLKGYMFEALEDKKKVTYFSGMIKEGNSQAYILKILRAKFGNKFKHRIFSERSSLTKFIRETEKQSRRAFITPPPPEVFTHKYIIEEI